MTSERLKQITTTFYQDASTTTLNEFIEHAMKDIEDRITTLYQLANKTDVSDDNKREMLCKELKNELYSTKFYYSFFRKGIKFLPVNHFRINPKNINFEMTITDLKEKFDDTHICPEEVCKSSQPSLRYIKDIPNWQDLFGKGEFPYMSIFVFRLGNTEYFAYDIHQ